MNEHFYTILIINIKNIILIEICDDVYMKLISIKIMFKHKLFDQFK